MTRIDAFSSTGNWYKGNLHCHSTNSDGALTPQEVVDLYKENGYSFLCLSDHDIYSDYRSQFNGDSFIVLPGMEASANLFDKEGKKRLKVHHIHGILGTTHMQQTALAKYEHLERHEVINYYGSWDGGQVGQILCDQMRMHGLITTYNHPIWSRVEIEEFCDLEGVWALEIFNYGTDIESGTGYDEGHWDDMLRAGKAIHAFASDDNHNKELQDSFGGYIMVKSDGLSHDEIIMNLLKGNYYSSAGPEIYAFYIEDGVVHFSCSDVYRIDIIVGNLVNDGMTFLANDHESSIHEAIYTLKGHETYVRVRCSDKYGRTAWTNALFTDQRLVTE